MRKGSLEWELWAFRWEGVIAYPSFANALRASVQAFPPPLAGEDRQRLVSDILLGSRPAC